MPFDFSELDERETALLALEYLRANARWCEQAAEETQYGAEITGTLCEVGAANRGFARDLAVRIEEHFGSVEGLAEETVRGLKRPDWLVDVTSEVTTGRDVLEVATAEQEEHYQFFLQQESEVEDPWLQQMFADLAGHARRAIVFLEEEREDVIELEG